MMKKYDAILILGNGLTDNWKLPKSVVTRLKYIAEMFKKGISDKIIVSGRWSISWDIKGIRPLTTEAKEMKKVLLDLEIPISAVIKEERSKDTIGNAYFSKIKILEPKNFKRILVVCADYHLKRAKFLFEKILGEDYEIEYLTTRTKSRYVKKIMKIQDDVLKGQSKFLEKMDAGDDGFLQTRLYNDPYYKKKRPAAEARIAMKGSD